MHPRCILCADSMHPRCVMFSPCVRELVPVALVTQPRKRGNSKAPLPRTGQSLLPACDKVPVAPIELTLSVCWRCCYVARFLQSAAAARNRHYCFICDTEVTAAQLRSHTNTAALKLIHREHTHKNCMEQLLERIEHARYQRETERERIESGTPHPAAAAAAAASAASATKSNSRSVAPDNEELVRILQARPLSTVYATALDAVVPFLLNSQVALWTRALHTLSEAVRQFAIDNDLQHDWEDSKLEAAQQRISGVVVQNELAKFEKLDLLPGQQATIAQLRELLRAEMMRIYAVLLYSEQLYIQGRLTFWGTKILVAQLANGAQSLHWDSTSESLQREDVEVTGLLYCTPCESARLPRFSRYWSERMVSSKESGRELAFMLHPRFFHSEPVQPGTLVLFRHTLPHAGTANTDPEGLRIVLFDAIVGMADAPSPEQQWFEWNFLDWAFGKNSVQSHAAITREEKYHARHPLQHSNKRAEASSVAARKRTALAVGELMAGDAAEDDKWNRVASGKRPRRC